MLDTQNLLNKIILKYAESKNSFEVTFTGGLGNQIISYLAFKYLQNIGKKVYANIDYFEDHSLKKSLSKKGLSIYKWELENYAKISLDKLKKTTKFKGKRNFLIKDGYIKYLLCFKCLNYKLHKRYLNLIDPNDILDKRILDLPNYICVHIRQGDFLKVASYVVNINRSLNIAKKFRGFSSTLIILSDGDIENKFIHEMEVFFNKVIKIINSEVIYSHSIMRKASILICSNSQFSLSASFIRDKPSLVPKKWFNSLAFMPLQNLINSQSSEFYLY